MLSPSRSARLRGNAHLARAALYPTYARRLGRACTDCEESVSSHPIPPQSVSELATAFRSQHRFNDNRLQATSEPQDAISQSEHDSPEISWPGLNGIPGAPKAPSFRPSTTASVWNLENGVEVVTPTISRTPLLDNLSSSKTTPGARLEDFHAWLVEWRMPSSTRLAATPLSAKSSSRRHFVRSRYRRTIGELVMYRRFVLPAYPGGLLSHAVA